MPAPAPEPPNVETTESGNLKNIIADVKIKVDVESNTARAEVSAAQSEKMLEEARQGNKEGKKLAVVLRTKVENNVAALDILIPKGTFDYIAKDTSANLTVDTGTMAVATFNNKALAAIANTTTSNEVTIKIKKVLPGELPEEIKALADGKPVYDFSVMAGDRQISDFGGGEVTIAIPYTLKLGEDLDSIIIYDISKEGKLETVTNSYFDSENGEVVFKTKYFSRYAVGYNKVNFNDVSEDVWYSRAVNYFAARNIISGTGNGKFSPDEKLTRAQLLVVVMKSYGIAPDTDPEDNFADAGDTYYTNYLAAAKRLKIVAGTGNNLFAPERPITRQEMFTLLYNILEQLNELPKDTSGKSVADFMDAGDIAPWAEEATGYWVTCGIINGSNSRLYPNRVSSRAEMVQILFNTVSNRKN